MELNSVTLLNKFLPFLLTNMWKTWKTHFDQTGCAV